MYVKAAINGGRMDAHVPKTPAEQAASAREAIAAGVNAIHAHARSADGAESLAADDVAALVRALREACGAITFGVSTGAWIVPDPAARIAAVDAWTEYPDFASVNFSEQGAVEVAKILFLSGVAIEAGLTNADDAQRFLDSGLPCIRVLLEPQEQVLEDALRSVDAIERVLASHESPRLLHGFDATAWPLVAEAKRRGYATRIGFEDTLTLPDGTPATSNAELIKAV